MRLLVLVALAIGLITPAAAQNLPAVPSLTANGEGKTFAPPDIATVSIGVASRADTPTAALAANNAEMARVIAAIRAAGVAERDVVTAGFSINPVYADPEPGRESQPPRILAYEVSNQVSVRIRDLAASGGVLDQVVAAGANQVGGISFDIADPQALKDEATRLAIADARRKAELMAAAAGVRLVRVLSVTAFDGGGPVFEARAMSAVPILGGERSLAVNATVTWEIAPL